jgi:hypothetical protein
MLIKVVCIGGHPTDGSFVVMTTRVYGILNHSMMISTEPDVVSVLLNVSCPFTGTHEVFASINGTRTWTMIPIILFPDGCECGIDEWMTRK